MTSNPGKFCPECGAPWSVAPADHETVASEADATTPSPSSSSSSDHARFEAGRRLGARYRVVGLLGRGGMGEVYRADDLELNQSVALKFLPERLARNAADLARLRSEVRTARQIAHPNVCRTYDIAEADGQIFVVMEYVDGEDLSSVLRRLGRPSPDKALEIARQLCLGLGAAHENGVLHRDLKPANIMIDGRGRVRITDFGLAGTAEEIAAESGVSGTPAYMAPEQRRSGGGTIQSDIFSLGLVLFEIFTGKKVHDVTPRPDGSRPGTDSSVRTPSSVVGGIDPAVERVILRCLENDPARRPQSAYAVFGALPGGDPLAAAVAAGETPSPELVANAGVEGSLRPMWAALAVAGVIAGLVAISFVQRPLFAGLDRSANVLSVRAEEALMQVTGKPAPHYSAEGFLYAPAADSTKAPSKLYWRRWSPRVMTSENIHYPGIDRDDPPQSHPTSGTVLLSTAGRLVALRVVPDLAADSAMSAAPHWESVVRAADLDPAAVTSAAIPDGFVVNADTVVAWRLSAPDAPETTLVAAALRGRIVEVSTRAGEKWISARPPPSSSEDNQVGISQWVNLIFFQLIPMIGSLFLMCRNLRARRGDLRGALTLGTAVVILYLLGYLFTVRAQEVGLYSVLGALTWEAPLGHALLHAVTMTISYLAIEPYVRRLWPGVLVSWARLVMGRWRDPIVGRDVLVGSAAGVALRLFGLLYEWGKRSTGALATPFAIPDPVLGRLAAPQAIFAVLAYEFAVALLFTTVMFTALVVLRYFLRNNLLAILALVLIGVLSGIEFGEKWMWLGIVSAVIQTSFGVFVALRVGFVAAVVAAAVSGLAFGLPWTTDFSAWFAPQTLLGWAFVAALMAYGLVTAVGGKSLFNDPLSDPVIGPGGQKVARETQ